MKSEFTRSAIGVCLCALIFGCSGSDSTVNFLSLKAFSTDSYKIEAQGSDQQFILVPFSANSYDEGDDPIGLVPFSVDFSVSVSEGQRSFIPSLAKTNELAAVSTASDDISAWEDTLKAGIEFENEKSEQSRQFLLDLGDYLKKKPRGFLKTRLQPLKDERLKAGTGVLYDLPAMITIKSPFDENDDGYDDNTPLNGILKAEGTNAAIYVDERNDGDVSEQTAQQLLDVFDEVTVPRCRTFFGTETDVNSDGVVIVFLSDHIDNGAYGFFRIIDLFPQEIVDAVWGSQYQTNYSEIIYVQYPRETGPYYKESIDATLAHEFTHLIHTAVKTYQHLVDDSELYLDSLFLMEGIAHLAEDVTGHGVDTYLLARIYLENNQSYSVAATGNNNGTRAATMLFLRYLFERKGGATYSKDSAADVSGPGVDFLRELVSSRYSGINNIEKTYGKSFEELFKKWVAALMLDGTGKSDNEEYNYDSVENDSFTGIDRGFDLRGSRTNPLGTKVTLDGPVLSDAFSTQDGLNDFSGSVYESGAKFYQLDLNSNEEVEVTLSGQAGEGLGMTIIKLQ